MNLENKMADEYDKQRLDEILQNQKEKMSSGQPDMSYMQMVHEFQHHFIGDNVRLITQGTQVLGTVRVIPRDNSDMVFIYSESSADPEELFDSLKDEEYKAVAFGETPEKLASYYGQENIRQVELQNEPWADTPFYKVNYQ